MTEAVPASQGMPTDRDAGPFDPPKAITQLRSTRPVSPLVFPDGHEGWLVTGYDAVRQVLADTRFSSRQDLGILHVPWETPGMPAQTEPSPQVPGLFVAMDGLDHSRLRRKLIGAFTVRRMKSLEEHIVEIVDQQLDQLAAMDTPVDLVKAFALPVPSLVICEMLGVPYEDRDTFQANSAQFLVKDQTLEAKMGAWNALTTYLAQLIVGKRAEPGEDLLSDLARDSDLSVEELIGIAFLLLLAGHETTANMLALGTFALLEHPEQLAELRDTEDPKLVANAVEELLRYLTIVHSGRRRVATEDIEVAGQLVRAGEGVILANDAGNRDEAQFPEPDTLDIHRQARHHVAFGFGVHQCLGQPLARMELQVVYSTLYRRIPTLKLAIPFEDVHFKDDMAVYGVHSLPVTW